MYEENVGGGDGNDMLVWDCGDGGMEMTSLSLCFIGTSSKVPMVMMILTISETKMVVIMIIMGVAMMVVEVIISIMAMALLLLLTTKCFFQHSKITSNLNARYASVQPAYKHGMNTLTNISKATYKTVFCTNKL